GACYRLVIICDRSWYRWSWVRCHLWLWLWNLISLWLLLLHNLFFLLCRWGSRSFFYYRSLTHFFCSDCCLSSFNLSHHSCTTLLFGRLSRTLRCCVNCT